MLHPLFKDWLILLVYENKNDFVIFLIPYNITRNSIPYWNLIYKLAANYKVVKLQRYFFCKNLGAKKGAWLVSHSKCIAITQDQYFSNNHEYSKGAYKIKIFCCERRNLEIKGINIIYYYKPYDLLIKELVSRHL